MWMTISRNWWSLVLRGAVAILFGLMVIIWPRLGLAALIALFGAYALVNGILAVVVALSHIGPRGDEWPLLLERILGVIVGALTFLWPGLTALASLLMMHVRR